jgi:hypothetical protein
MRFPTEQYGKSIYKWIIWRYPHFRNPMIYDDLWGCDMIWPTSFLIQGGDLTNREDIQWELSSGKQQLAMQHHRVRKLRIIWRNGPFSIAGNPSIWARNPATIPVNVFPDIIRISIHWEFPGITLQQMLSYIYYIYIENPLQIISRFQSLC